MTDNFFVSVLPLSCSYLWGLYDDEDTCRVTGEETTQDQSPRNLSENNNNFGAVKVKLKSAEILNFENSEAVRSSNAIQYVSVNNDIEKTELNKSQEKMCGVKEYVKEKVNETGSNHFDTAPSSSDTDDYNANNVAVNEIRRSTCNCCSILNKGNGRCKDEKIEREHTKNEITESENLTKDQTVLLKGTKNKITSRMKKNGILSADITDIGNTSIRSDLESVKKLKLRQSSEKSRWKTKDGKVSKVRSFNVSKNVVNDLNFLSPKRYNAP